MKALCVFFIKNLITILTLNTISSSLVCPAATTIYSFYELVSCRQVFRLCLLYGFKVVFGLSLTIIKNIYLIIIIIYITLQPHFYLVWCFFNLNSRDLGSIELFCLLNALIFVLFHIFFCALLDCFYLFSFFSSTDLYSSISSMKPIFLNYL